MLLVLFLQQGTAATELDVEAAVKDAVYRLGFQNLTDLETHGWLGVGELYQWADDAAKELSYRAGVFAAYDESIAVTPGTALYSQPARHVRTLAAWLCPIGGGPRQPLRITAVRDLWALDDAWETATGSPRRASLDAGGVGTLTLYPNPTAGGTVGQVCRRFPSPIAAAAARIALPTVLQDYFAYAMLAGARGKESEGAMPEMAAHFRLRLELYDQVIEHLWGAGQ